MGNPAATVIISSPGNTWRSPNKVKKEFHPGEKLPYASRVYDQEEMCNLVDSALEFWLTSGRYTNPIPDISFISLLFASNLLNPFNQPENGRYSFSV